MNVNRLLPMLMRMGMRYLLPLITAFVAKRAAKGKPPEEAAAAEERTKKSIKAGTQAARVIRRLR